MTHPHDIDANITMPFGSEDTSIHGEGRGREMPEDIRETVDALESEIMIDFTEADKKSIALVILAERQRCLAEADHFLTDIQISIDGRSRFDIGDINRQANKAVRYVRDRISGDYEKNWSSVPRAHPSTPITPSEAQQ